MSKASELDQTVKLYLLECMDFEGYDDILGKYPPVTTQEKITACECIFNAEIGDHLTGKIGKQAAIQVWLQGLPSCINIAFYNHVIIRLAVSWGSIPSDYTEKQADDILENYWSFMAAKLLQLFNGYRVPKETK